MDKIYGTNSSLISIFQRFSASIKKALGLGEDWALGYKSMKF